MLSSSIKSSAIIAGKLALAASSIVGIAWLVGVYQPDGTVQESQADILDLSLIERSEEMRFADGLDELDHDAPQSLSINGNVVHFSMARHRKRPEQLMKEYQEEFVYQGLNKHVYTPKNISEHSDDFWVDGFTGGLVPQMVTPDYASLGGLQSADGVDDKTDLMDKAIDRARPNEIFVGHRFIEMFWDKHRRRSTVTATWSDRNFDYRKMIPNHPEVQQDLGVDPRVPSCPGCIRLNATSDLDPERSYGSNIFEGDRGKRQTIEFYRDSMRRRGWIETDASLTFQAIRQFVRYKGDDSQMLQLTKNNRYLTVLAFPSETGKTTVHTVISE
jgi:hypothetical protein